MEEALMDEHQVRERAEAVCAALVDGDIPRMSEDVSKELKSNLGEVLARYVIAYPNAAPIDQYSPFASTAGPRGTISEVSPQAEPEPVVR
jgi:hypothetical protein